MRMRSFSGRMQGRIFREEIEHRLVQAFYFLLVERNSHQERRHA